MWGLLLLLVRDPDRRRRASVGSGDAAAAAAVAAGGGLVSLVSEGYQRWGLFIQALPAEVTPVGAFASLASRHHTDAAGLSPVPGHVDNEERHRPRQPAREWVNSGWPHPQLG